MKTFRSFCRLEPDTVWLLVKELYNDDVMTPPHNSFPQPKVGIKIKCPTVERLIIVKNRLFFLKLKNKCTLISVCITQITLICFIK